MAEASDFKVHHIITSIGKSECGLKLGEQFKILSFPYNIAATAEASKFKIGMLLFAKAHRKILHRKKWTWPCAIGGPQNFGVPL